MKRSKTKIKLVVLIQANRIFQNASFIMLVNRSCHILRSLQDLDSRRRNFSPSVAGAGMVDLQRLHVTEAALWIANFESEGSNREGPMKGR